MSTATMYDTPVTTRTEPKERRDGSIALAVGPIVALATAGFLAHFRDTAGATNVALVLAVIVVAAALAGRMAGVVTAIVAAAGFNFFHAQPYHSLRISGARDVVTVVLLAVMGLVVSEIGAWRRRSSVSSTRRLHGSQALETTAAMLAAGEPSDAVWETIRSVLIEEMQLADCRFEPQARQDVPVLPRSGSLVATSMYMTSHGFALPAGGVAIPVVSRNRSFGQIVLTAAERSGSVLETRRLAVALADQYAVALAIEAATDRGR